MLLLLNTNIYSETLYEALKGESGTEKSTSYYAEATGKGGVVQATVDVKINIPKKVSLAIKEQDGSLRTSNLNLFRNIILPNNSKLSLPTDFDLLSSFDKEFTESLEIYGAIYANSAARLTINATEFTHEIDSNSKFGSKMSLIIRGRDFTQGTDLIKINNNNSPRMETTIDSSTLYNQKNLLTFLVIAEFTLSPMELQNKPRGEYVSSLLIEVSLL